MLRALLLKEWIKLRLPGWLPLVGIAVALTDAWMTMRAIRNNHGAVPLWSMLIYKQDIFFGMLVYILPLSGAWLAAVQYWRECSGRRLRLLFHLPVHHRVALFAPAAVGLAVLAALTVVELGGFALMLASFDLPAELAGAMLRTLLPSALGGAVAYLAVAAVLAEQFTPRRLGMGMAGLIYIALLTRTFGYGGMDASLWLYAAACLPWLLPVEAAALRVKEGA